MKFWRVDEPFTARVPAVTAPLNVPVVPDTLVNAAIEAKRFVEVAAVVVEFVAVNAWRVVDPFTRRFPDESEPEIVADPPKSEVNDPMVEKKLVLVALVDVEF